MPKPTEKEIEKVRCFLEMNCPTGDYHTGTAEALAQLLADHAAEAQGDLADTLAEQRATYLRSLETDLQGTYRPPETKGCQVRDCGYCLVEKALKDLKEEIENPSPELAMCAKGCPKCL